MKRISWIVFAALSAFAESRPEPRVFIEPQDGFESYLSAAIVKKQTPVVVTQNRDDATYVITSKVVGKEETKTEKVLSCVFVYCAGIQGQQTATIQMIDPKTQEIVFAYNVRKVGTDNYQSTSEAIAKHLKQFLEHRRAK